MSARRAPRESRASAAPALLDELLATVLGRAKERPRRRKRPAASPPPSAEASESPAASPLASSDSDDADYEPRADSEGEGGPDAGGATSSSTSDAPSSTEDGGSDSEDAAAAAPTAEARARAVRRFARKALPREEGALKAYVVRAAAGPPAVALDARESEEAQCARLLFADDVFVSAEALRGGNAGALWAADRLPLHRDATAAAHAAYAYPAGGGAWKRFCYIVPSRSEFALQLDAVERAVRDAAAGADAEPPRQKSRAAASDDAAAATASAAAAAELGPAVALAERALRDARVPHEGALTLDVCRGSLAPALARIMREARAPSCHGRVATGANERPFGAQARVGGAPVTATVLRDLVAHARGRLAPIPKDTGMYELCLAVGRLDAASFEELVGAVWALRGGAHLARQRAGPLDRAKVTLRALQANRMDARVAALLRRGSAA